MSAATPSWIRHGVPAYDPATGMYGTVAGIGEPYTLPGPPDVVYLRPLGGGIEWRADIHQVQPALTPVRGGLR
ncbi:MULTISPECIES: hypothetical protein [Streptomycetaceae]|uniref:Uncharacterized protein n=1 Tax=Streptantibioticus cattleyicolor (strain ATCC 35852 / DSM 46488 / JCM 4925 / NBRC 14057 / NRRL 8057) TaxID=1003195 RepID=F8K4D7_STREN|nr:MULTISPECIES: hypothetical protein [Streptomycetaceae]AEW93896.1 hypothetical protein SCATT_15250 [Streptantibioticus cattleyicolor NRRL 8057 = DSM 46488]MYS58577.1 hypothetical protein [Streptomyces sp. SID5468]CCB74243.1 protein of unknown function [Streptantibioticus cattleyicolor NRRL 8057 = DSM 46488]